MVDWDALVDRVAGMEGGPRYQRLGLTLLVLGLVGLLVVLAMPIISLEETAESYFSLAADPDEVNIFIPNSVVLKRANIAVAGFALLMAYGAVLFLEGRRALNLRRVLPWHAEVRATALYALGTVIAFVAVVGAGALISFAISEPVIRSGDVTITTEVGSPAGAVALVVGMLPLLGLLFLTYYNTVLSVYRGGHTKRTRRMARWAVIVAFLALMGFFMLHAMNVAVIHWDYGPEAGDVDYLIPYTLADVDYWADQDQPQDFGPLDGALDWLGWSLLATAFLALGGLVGVAAHSLHGESRRVRLATVMPVLAFITAPLAFAGAVSASSSIGGLGGGYLYLNITPLVATPVLAGMVLPWIGLLFAGLYVREAGVPFVMSAWVPTREPGPPEPAPTPPGAAPEEAPTEVEPVEEGPPEAVARPPRRGPARPRPMLLAVAAVAALVVIAAVAFGWRGGDGGDGDDGRPRYDIEDLDFERYQVSWEEYIAEGDELSIDVFAETLDQVDFGSAVLYIDYVWVTVEWQDEPDRGFLGQGENQPDTFRVEVYDDRGIQDMSSEGTNTRPNDGQVLGEWDPGDQWAAYGDADVAPNTGDALVQWDARVHATVTMVDAGDYQYPVRPSEADGGNMCTARITVTGYLYQHGTDGQ